MITPDSLHTVPLKQGSVGMRLSVIGRTGVGGTVLGASPEFRNAKAGKPANWSNTCALPLKLIAIRHTSSPKQGSVGAKLSVKLCVIGTPISIELPSAE